MKKSLLLFMCLVLIGTISAQSPQLTNLGFAPYYLHFPASGSPVWQNYPNYSGVGASNYQGASNVCYDNAGQPVFYVVGDDIIYPDGTNAYNSLPNDADPGGSGSNNSTNIGIFPIDVACGKQLLIYNKYNSNTLQSPQYGLLYSIFDPNKPTMPFETGLGAGSLDNVGVIVNNDIGHGHESPYSFAVSTYNNSLTTFGGTTSQKEIGRVIFWTDGTVLNATSLRFTINSSGGVSVEQHTNTIYVFASPTWTPLNGTSQQELYGEMEVKVLKGTGTTCNPSYRVAFSSYGFSGTAQTTTNVEKKVVVCDIDYATVMNPNVTPQKIRFFDVSNGQDNDVHFKGLEFSPNATLIYVTHTGNNPVQFANVNNAANNSSTLLTNVPSFPNTSTDPISSWQLSSIEIAPDGQLYYVKENKLLAMSNPDNSTTHTYSTVNFPGGFTYNTENYNGSGIGDLYEMYLFPKKTDDQDMVTPPINISASSTQACERTTNFTITNADDAIHYEWTVTGGQVISNHSVCNNSLIQVQWFADPDCPNRSLGGTVQAHAVGYCSESDSPLLTIDPCCGRMTRDFIFYNQNISGQTFSNKTIVIDGTNNKVLAGQNVVFNSCTILMGPGAKLTNFGSIKLNNSIVKAGCCEMWEAIDNQAGSTLLINKSTVQDGINAIIINNNTFFTLYDSRFNINKKSVTLKQYSTPANSSIEKCLFTCDNGSGTPAQLPLSPFMGELGVAGVWSENSTFTIGTPNKTKTNWFKYMNIGVYAVKSNLTIINNRFDHLINLLNTTGLGYGILSEGYGGASASPFVGLTVGGSNNKYGNYFTLCHMGIRTAYNHNLIVNYNTFASNFYGMYTIVMTNPNAVVYFNDFNDNKYSLFMSKLSADKSTSIVDINSNNINLSATQSIPTNIGIWISNTTQSKQTENVMINGNTVKKCERGVYVINLTEPTISSNHLTEARHSTSASNLVEQIGVYASINPTIQSNYIDGAYTFNSTAMDGWASGIKVSTSPQAIIGCNHTANIANGIKVAGDCFVSRVLANNMQNNYRGFVMNNANTLGQQVTGGIKADNSWAGEFVSHLYVEAGSGLASGWYITDAQCTTGTAGSPTPCASPNPFVSDFGAAATPIPYNYIGDAEPSANPGCSPAQQYVQDHNQFGQYAREVINGTLHNPVYGGSLVIEKMNLYSMLLQDPSLLSADAALLSFKSDIENGTLGALDLIGRSIGDKEEEVLQRELTLNQLEGMSFSSPYESQLATTLEAELSFNEVAETGALIAMRTAADSTQEGLLNELRAIAAECPFEYGAAVYNARALLYLIDTGIVHYQNACEESIIIPSRNGRLANNEGIAGEKAVTKNGQVKIYPNPANNTLIIETESITYNAEVYTTNGLLVCKKNIGNTGNIDVTDLSNGMYLLKLNDGQKSQYLKFVVNH